MKKKSLVLLSGGLDSAANLALSCIHDEVVLALTIDYGQRAAENEKLAARNLSQHFKVPHQILDLRFIKDLGTSALTHVSSVMPNLKEGELDDRLATQRSAAAVWVPNRNGVFLSVAAALAEARGIDQVMVGFNKEEAATFADNTAAFAEAFSDSLKYSTQNHVRVHCYTFELTKIEIVKKLKEEVQSFPFEKIWSCYEAGAEPCQKCESCQRLARALQANSVGKKL